MQLYRITINSKLYELEVENYSILQLCEILHIGIPRFCYHEHLSIAGNCRMCLVELKNSLKPIVSCAYQIADNMILFTNSQLIKHARENILEFLLINHPLDCPICDQGGECDLQDQTLIYGRDKSRFSENKRSVLEKNWGPLIKAVMTRCIHCTRCIRYFSEIVGLDKFGTIGRGMNTEIESYVDIIIDSEISGNVVDLCPVGALTSKPYSFTARPWELLSFESIDLLDGYCSFIRIDLRSQNILRILPVIKRVDYDYWITDKVRFSYDAFKKQRLKSPKIALLNSQLCGINTKFKDSSFEFVFKYMFVNFVYCIKQFGFNHVYFFTGKYMDIIELLIIKNLTLALNISNLNILNYFEIDFRNQYLVHNQLLQVEYENSFLIYGINTKLESSILNIKLRKLSLSSNTNKFFYLGNHIEVNYSIIHIGLTMLQLLDIYHGKHFTCFYIANHECFNFIHGPSSYFDEYSYYIVSNLSSYLKKRIQYSYNNLFSNDTSIYEYNACARTDASLFDSEYNCPKYIYLFNSDITSYFNKNAKAFIIYQSHHFDDIAAYANVLLPTGTHLDKKGYYINYQGDILYSGPILNSTELSKHADSHIFFAFFNYVKQNLKLNTCSSSLQTTWDSQSIYRLIVQKNNLYLNSKVLNILDVTNNIYIYDILLIRDRKNHSKKLFIDDSFFITTNRNFFTMDLFSRNSVYINNYLSYKQVKQINITQKLF